MGKLSKSGALIGVIAWAGAILGAAGAPQAPAQVAPPGTPAAAHGAVITKYCVTCHSKRLQTGGLSLEGLDVATAPTAAATWERVIRKLRAGAMPPAGMPRPDDATRVALAAYLETEIDRASAKQPNPGRTEVFHRLNRTEYQNAVRDLLDVEVDVSTLVPADDQSYGFDNIAGVLKISPTLLERYVRAAREISSLAVGASKRMPIAETFRLRSDLSQYSQMQGLPFGTRGGTAIRYTFPRDADYTVTVEMLEFIINPGAVKEVHTLEISIDGERIGVFEITPGAPRGSDGHSAEYAVRLPVKAGPHVVTATFVNKTSALAEGVREPFARPHGEGDYVLYQPHIGTLTVTGPFEAAGVRDTPSRRRIFVCQPAKPAEEAPCAREIVSALARRAFRRPVAEDKVRRLVGFYEEGRAEGSFDAGIEAALRAILVTPDFLYRVELDPPKLAAGSVYRLGDLELASRLSFFLWSSLPDDELLEAAAAGRLKDPVVLERQVRRMLRDPRSTALATNFAGQWLKLRNISGTQPDNDTFPNFSDNLRQAFVRETELLFDSIVKEDRSVMDLLTADYTFVNEPLARFYGIPSVYGTDFQRVKLADTNRRGLLGQGSILLVTSYADRTSPVGRGKWILENILGTPPPPPPPVVPELRQNGDGVTSKALSMRERMAGHRANPTCATCHTLMDPLGFALENFDAVGRWRAVDESGNPVDASGTMPDGRKFTGPAGLRDLLATNPEQFVTVVVEKLMVYALGRGIEHHDAPTVRQIVRGAAANDYSLASVIAALVKSPPFTMRTVGVRN